METDFFQTMSAQLPYYRSKLAAIPEASSLVGLIDAAITKCQDCINNGEKWADQAVYAPMVQNITAQYQKLSQASRDSFDAACKTDAQAKVPPHA